MIMGPLVSAIITTYQRTPDYVLRAVTSVKNQTYQNIEILVVDDSPDSFPGREDVRKALEELDQNIRYIPHKTNMGACAARNTGLHAARGVFIGYLDDDDEWLPEKIERQLQMFSKAEIGLVYCGSLTTNDQTGVTTVRDAVYFSGYVYEQLIQNNFIGSTSFPLIRKQVLLEVVGFDPLMQSAQDYDVWTRISQKYAVAFVEEPLVRYHVHGDERITSNPAKRIQGQERYILKNMDYIAGNKEAWHTRHIRLATEYAKDRQMSKAVGLWMRSVQKCPQKFRQNGYYLLKVVLEYFRAGKA